MGFTEVTIIVDGAVESDETFKGFDTTELEVYLERQKTEALEAFGLTGIETEIYTMEHEHDESEDDCSCAQYLTDHHPIWSTSND